MNDHFFTAFLLISVCFLTSCAMDQIRHPAQMSVVTDVYANADSAVPVESHVQSIYPVAFEDVFQSTTSSLALANIFPVNIDQDNGVILGQRSERNPKSSLETRYFYKISVLEAGEESTIVDVLSKVQSECTALDVGVGWDIASLGITAAARAADDTEGKNDLCEQFISQPNWSEGNRRDTVTMQKLHQMIQINLVKAGLM